MKVYELDFQYFERRSSCRSSLAVTAEDDPTSDPLRRHESVAKATRRPLACDHGDLGDEQGASPTKYPPGTRRARAIDRLPRTLFRLSFLVFYVHSVIRFDSHTSALKLDYRN
ncbi:hypothetical protein EVAR_79128_1 [Eumeta japonica]|uniref:Uncharacterized protein n=1 Tax=Eumeta variegata TaxID=151549 RepID=A0A4C1UTE3_EUMVA|nr:hypothetical protein EVAR_79128_1 [Eumeta japonica]